MTSIVDVAKHAHVGVGTVSRVLSGKGYVSEKTRDKVMASVKALNYTPNEVARNLLHNRTNTVAVIVPDLSNRFYTSFVNELEYLLRKKGYKTLLCNSFGKETNEEIYLNMLNQNLVDGVITASNLLSNSSYAKITKPIVSLDSVLSPDIPMVCCDHKTGGQQAARLMIESGCKHVLQFRDGVDLDLKNFASDVKLTIDDFPYVKRHMEFERIIREQEDIIYEEVQTISASSLERIRNLAEQVYLSHPDVDGVMATDVLAIQYASVALSHGKKIPEDIRIVAYDGTDFLDLFYPPLSAIVQPIGQLADACVEYLIQQIEHEPIKNNRKILPVQIIDRTKLQS